MSVHARITFADEKRFQLKHVLKNLQCMLRSVCMQWDVIIPIIHSHVYIIVVPLIMSTDTLQCSPDAQIRMYYSGYWLLAISLHC